MSVEALPAVASAIVKQTLRTGKVSMIMTGAEPDALNFLVAQVLESAKYRHIAPDLIRRIGRSELAMRRNIPLKEAVKETKNKLHQVAGAYLDRRTPYADWLARLKTAAESGSSEALRELCYEIMGSHASTRERLPVIEHFYAACLERVQPVRSVLDIACGLNPLSISWMPLAPDAPYYACDLYGDMMAFVGRFLEAVGRVGSATAQDVVSSPPTQSVHLALILKALPPLEQTGKTAGIDLLRAVNAEHLLVSFPTRTLAGRNKQMSAHYETRFRGQTAEEGWTLERHEFANELCFLVTK